jgi:Na+/melibiose symporter-like transporter
MTDYNLIFGAVLLFNIVVTFRASSYYKQFFPSSSSKSSTKDDDNDGLELEGGGVEDTTTPLVTKDSNDKNDDDDDEVQDEEIGSSDIQKGSKKDAESSAASDTAANIRHSQLLRKYLFVYLFAACSDWLQGPYVYALYDAYGYSQHDIAVLFVAGFGSSMVFGSFVGGMADQGGRKKFVILFAIIYSLSCMTKRKRILYLCCALLLLTR